MISGARVIAVPVGAAAACSFVLLLLRSVSLRYFKAWAGGREHRARVLSAVRRPLAVPSVYWCIAAGLYLGMAVSDLPAKYVFYCYRTIHVILVLSMSIAVANVAASVFGAQMQKLDLPLSSTTLVGGVLKGAVIVIGMLIILGILGISIAPLITALGVGGLAVALALQDTLANLFAGLHLLIEKSIRVGDFIKLESGHEGYVDDITWRTSRIRTLSNNTVMIPNKKLAQSEVVNYSLPQPEMSISVVLRAGYGADHDLVERVLVEEAQKAVSDLPGLVEGQKPSVAFNPGESWVEFSLNFTVKRFVDQYAVQDAVRKRVFRRFAQEGIEIPFTTRTVYLKEAPPP
jgi:small-conductance mechanosensitive channel